MAQRYCESCGNLFEADATSGTTPEGSYLCPECALKKQDEPKASPEASGADKMDKGAGLKKSANESEEDEKLTFRCPNCNALLSSKKIEKRSRLTCPKCSEKVVLNPDGTADLLEKREPHMKPMDIPRKEKIFSDNDLEKLLDFGETQPINRGGGASRDTSDTSETEQAPGPQYMTDEEQDRIEFLDKVQGPGGGKKKRPANTLDSELPPGISKRPVGKKKLTKFGTDRHKSETVEDRLATTKIKRRAARNKVLAVIFIIVPIIVGIALFYSSSKEVPEGQEKTGLAKLISSMGKKAHDGALALNSRFLKQEVTVHEEKNEETGETPQQETETLEVKEESGETVEPEPDKQEPVETEQQPEPPQVVPEDEGIEENPRDGEEKAPVKPADGDENPVELPEEPGEKPVTPEEPAQPEKPVEPEKPAETPKSDDTPSSVSPETPETPKEPEEPKEPETPGTGKDQKKSATKEESGEYIKCPECGRAVKKTDEKCEWCGAEIKKAPKESSK